MIEKIVIDYLSGALAVPVAAEVPPGPPERFCTVQKTGQDERDGLLAALIAVRSTAPSKWETMQLSAAVRAAMALLRAEEINVFSARCTTEYDDTKTNPPEYGYKAVFRVVYTTERS